ncbi:MAG: peptide ABC transporter substrate-binding protein, partial [Pseudomonadota bacterium]
LTSYVGATASIQQRAQFANYLGPRAPKCTAERFTPKCTGPCRVEAFRPSDLVHYAINEAHLDPAKPAVLCVLPKGDRTAKSARRAALETGEFDYAWTLQPTTEALASMKAAGRAKVSRASAHSWNGSF